MSYKWEISDKNGPVGTLVPDNYDDKFPFDMMLPAIDLLTDEIETDDAEVEEIVWTASAPLQAYCLAFSGIVRELLPDDLEDHELLFQFLAPDGTVIYRLTTSVSTKVIDGRKSVAVDMRRWAYEHMDHIVDPESGFPAAERCQATFDKMSNAEKDMIVRVISHVQNTLMGMITNATA